MLIKYLGERNIKTVLLQDFPAAGNTTSLELIMVRCLQIEMSMLSLTVSVELRGPASKI